MIDHGILSPSGRVSRRARKVALERVRRELFGSNGLARSEAKQPPEHEEDRGAGLLDRPRDPPESVPQGEGCTGRTARGGQEGGRMR